MAEDVARARIDCGCSESGHFRWSPDLEVQGDDAGNGAAERNGGLAGEGFAQDLHAARSGPAIDHIDLGKGNVGKFFVFPKNGGRGNEQTDVEAIVATFAIEESDELIEAGGPAGTGESEAPRSAIEHVAVGDENAKR